MQKNNVILQPRIKICGLTSLYQAMTCVELGADWLGFNCWRGSSRFIKPREIREIVSSLPKSITSVGIFVNESPELLEKIMEDTGLDFAQLHGDETIEFIAKINVPWFKAFRVTPEFKSEHIKNFGQDLFLLDSFSKNFYGGSGKKLDWDQVSNFSSLGKLILAGGLYPGNIIEAIKKVNPWGVDVCSGVESEPGKKDFEKVATFIENIRKIKKIKKF